MCAALLYTTAANVRLARHRNIGIRELGWDEAISITNVFCGMNLEL